MSLTSLADPTAALRDASQRRAEELRQQQRWRADPVAWAAERANLLAGRIAEAMNNTAMGLGIAATCMIAHVFLNAASKKQMHELESFAMKLENLLIKLAGGR